MLQRNDLKIRHFPEFLFLGSPGANGEDNGSESFLVQASDQFQELALRPVVTDPALLVKHAGALLSIGLAGGLAELFSAWMQGAIGAAGCRAMSEGEGKGLIFIIIAMGIAETVGLFGFVFLLLAMPG